MSRKENLDYLLDNDIDVDNRIVYLHGDIEFIETLKIRKIIKYWEEKDGDKEITIDINSLGGDVYDSLAIVDTIRSCKCPIKTIASGACMSGASLIFVVGDERVATENATFMLHELSSWEADRHSQIKNNVQHNDKLMDKMYEIYSSYTNITRAELRRRLVKDWYLTAEEALDRKICDEIIKNK